MKTTSLLFGLFLAGCASAPAPATTTPPPPAKPIVFALQTHDGKVAIVGGGELRVDVTKDDGTVVAENATLDELRAKDPDTWMLVTSAVATAPSSGTYLDATYVATPVAAIR